MIYEYDYVVIIWGYRNVLFTSKDLKECFDYMDHHFLEEDLVILYGEEDIPDDWPLCDYL